MKIARVEAVPLDARLKAPFRFGNVVRTTSANVLVRVVGEDGLVGYGEACPVPQLTAETQESVVALVEQRVAPELVGEDARQWRPIIDHQDGLVFVTGLSGHGLALGPVIGEITADLALDGGTARPTRPFRLARFREERVALPDKMI
jgi:glycine/D-amino acid oxidase-like deaminating enzyme